MSVWRRREQYKLQGLNEWKEYSLFICNSWQFEGESVSFLLWGLQWTEKENAEEEDVEFYKSISINWEWHYVGKINMYWWTMMLENPIQRLDDKFWGSSAAPRVLLGLELEIHYPLICDRSNYWLNSYILQDGYWVCGDILLVLLPLLVLVNRTFNFSPSYKLVVSQLVLLLLLLPFGHVALFLSVENWITKFDSIPLDFKFISDYFVPFSSFWRIFRGEMEEVSFVLMWFSWLLLGMRNRSESFLYRILRFPEV